MILDFNSDKMDGKHSFQQDHSSVDILDCRTGDKEEHMWENSWDCNYPSVSHLFDHSNL